MSIILIAVAISLALVVVLCVVARTRLGTGGVVGLSLAAGILACFVFPVVSLQAFLTMFVTAICYAFRARPIIVTVCIVVAAAISYLIVLPSTLAQVAELKSLRASYPLESVADRLAYESERREVARDEDAGSHVEVPLSAPVEQRLVEFERRGSSNMRRYMLERLHDKTYENFVAANGFGAIRMIRVSRPRIELPPAEPIPLPAASESPSADPNVAEAAPQLPLAVNDEATESAPSTDDLLSLHWNGLEDFLETERFGYVQDRNHVAGFEPHRFMRMPEIVRKEEAPPAWRVARLELVSLLKHASPRVYVSEYLPQMDQLKDAATRPLSHFESDALPQLRHDEDLVIGEDAHRIRMLGSVRAGNACLECHDARRGELLGAFSYELAPTYPVPAVPQEAKPHEPQASVRPSSPFHMVAR